MLQDLVTGIIYTAAVEQLGDEAKKHDGWWVAGHGYMFPRGATPPADALYWAMNETILTYEFETI